MAVASSVLSMRGCEEKTEFPVCLLLTKRLRTKLTVQKQIGLYGLHYSISLVVFLMPLSK